MSAFSRALTLGALLLGMLTLIAVAPVQAQDDSCPDNAWGTGSRGDGNTVHGTDCQDWLQGWDEDDVLYGYGGNDSLYANAGDDRLYGHEDDDTLNGGRGSDVLVGGSGDDDLNGGRGDDTLDGGRGDDTLKGGRGDDRFWYANYPLQQNGNDEITDFKPGEDVIMLRGGTVNQVGGEVFIGFTGFDRAGNPVDSALSASGSDTILDLSTHGGGQIRLKGIAPEDLSADDCVFIR